MNKIIISENQFKLLINNVINESQWGQKINNKLHKEYVSYFQNKNIGINGSLTPNNGLKHAIGLTVHNFDTDYENNDYNSYIENFGLIGKIWVQYAKSMSRRREDSVLPFENFNNYLRNDNVYYFTYNDNFIIGQYYNGFFKPSHFAPSSIRGGVDVIKEIIKYDNIIFAVTNDLSDMLIKMDLYSDPNGTIPMVFREMLVQKNIITTNIDVLAEILEKLEKVKNGDIDYMDAYDDINYQSIKNKNEKWVVHDNDDNDYVPKTMRKRKEWK